MDEMLQFIEFNSVANMRAYGLGVQVYTRSFSAGKHAIGHGGGNIGTTTYMIYFPDYHLSIVVMINAFPNKGADVITRGLIRIVLKKLGAIAIDMETATVFVVGHANEISRGALLLVSDMPLLPDGVKTE